MSHTRSSEKSPKPGLQLNIRLLPVVVGILLLLYVLTGYRGWLAFLIGTAGAWLLAFVWVRSLARGLSLQRRVHLAWAAVGDSVPEFFELTNRSRLPALWVEVVDQAERLADPLRLVTDVDSRISRRRHPIHHFKRRGLYTLGPTRVRTGDPFGIYSLTLHDSHLNRILITPPELPLKHIQIAPGGWAGDRERRRHTLAHEESQAGVRDYQPGDSLKRIHWPASAHTDSLMVRQPEAARSEDWWIFLDLDQAVQAGSGQDSTLELSIVLAASLIRRGWQEHRRVGLALAGPDLAWLEPRSDSLHRWNLMSTLAMAEAGPRSLIDLLSMGEPTGRAAWIVITPAVDAAWVGRLAQRSRQRNITVLLVDPVEFGGSRDQGRVSTTLAQYGIPHTRMPRSLLDQAYSPTSKGRRRSPIGVEAGRRYLEQGGANWQGLD